MKNLILILLVILVVSCKTSKDPAKRYAKEHQNKSYAYVMDNSESFTLKSLKEDKKTLQEKLRGVGKKNNKHTKIQSLEETLAELRVKIEEYEKRKNN